jgi:hypothetical protein
MRLRLAEVAAWRGKLGAVIVKWPDRRLAKNILGPVHLRSLRGNVRGQVKGACDSKAVFDIAWPSVTERLRVAGNADWQEKRVPHCWPSVNGGTSGLEYGAGKPPPLNCQVLYAGVS